MLVLLLTSAACCPTWRPPLPALLIVLQQREGEEGVATCSTDSFVLILSSTIDNCARLFRSFRLIA